MLGKLIKYDIKSSQREFLGIFIAIIAACLLISLTVSGLNNGILMNNMIEIILMLIVTGLFIGAFVISIMTIFRMYNNRIYGREGYLTMTLPVKGLEVVASKLIVTTMWMILTGVAFFVGMVLFFFISADLSNIFFGYEQFWAALGEQKAWIMIILISFILQTLNSIIALYLSCSVAHLAIFKRFKIIVGIATFFIISIIESIIASFFSGFFPTEEVGNSMMALSSVSAQLNYFSDAMQPAMILSMLLVLGFAVVKFILTVLIIDKKLELE